MRYHDEQKIKISSLIICPAFIALCLSNAIRSCTPLPINGAIIVEEQVSESHTKYFLPGEHIVSVPIDNKLKSTKIEQYPYHEGYKCVGMSSDSKGGVILYVNTEAVYSKSNKINSNQEYVYTEFGSVEKKHSEDKEDENSKIFDVGEHIISVPISNPLDKEIQYYSYPGYEPLDISYYVYGRLVNFGGANILYTNTTPVKCDKINGEYANFGTPIQQEKTLTK